MARPLQILRRAAAYLRALAALVAARWTPPRRVEITERAPRKGEKICVPGYAIECIDVSGSRITRVKVTEEPVALGPSD